VDEFLFFLLHAALPFIIGFFLVATWPKPAPRREFRTPRDFRTWELELAVRRAEAILARHEELKRLAANDAQRAKKVGRG